MTSVYMGGRRATLLLLLRMLQMLQMLLLLHEAEALCVHRRQGGSLDTPEPRDVEYGQVVDRQTEHRGGGRRLTRQRIRCTRRRCG